MSTPCTRLADVACISVSAYLSALCTRLVDAACISVSAYLSTLSGRRADDDVGRFQRLNQTHSSGCRASSWCCKGRALSSNPPTSSTTVAWRRARATRISAPPTTATTTPTTWTATELSALRSELWVDSPDVRR